MAKLIDAFEEAGAALEEVPEADGRRDRIERLVLPIWTWLNGVPALAREAQVEWSVVDEAISEAEEERIAMALSELTARSRESDQVDVDRAADAVRQAILEGVASAQERLREAGVETHSVSRLFWPVRSEVASWRQQEQSDDALVRVRSALTEVSARGLALSFDRQFDDDLTQANRFRLGAILFFMAALAWAIAALETLPMTVTAAGIAGRGVVSLSLIIMGGFLVRESVQHRARCECLADGPTPAQRD
jgi:hypothetical protein